MALVHRFASIPKNAVFRGIPENMNFVEIPDDFMRYIIDTLAWINSKWNGKEKKSGISYYGFSIIEEDEIKKCIEILKKWKELFSLAPEKIFLTGSFLLEEKRYEKKEYNVVDIVKMLDLWIALLEDAIRREENILHSGI